MPVKRLWLPFWQLLCQSIEGLDKAAMPRRCVFCGLASRDSEHLICAACDAELPRIRRQCPGCAQALTTVSAETVLCADCQARPTPFEFAFAPLAYEFPVDAAIRMFKYRRKLHYAPAFGELLLREAARLPDDIDALLPVPLHWLRHGFRGFNQAVELCRPIQKATGLPVIRKVRRARSTRYQSGLSSRERRRNLKNAFTMRGRVDADHVLIVDDVITTGETCRQLARLLQNYGVDKVSVLALARA